MFFKKPPSQPRREDVALLEMLGEELYRVASGSPYTLNALERDIQFAEERNLLPNEQNVLLIKTAYNTLMEQVHSRVPFKVPLEELGSIDNIEALRETAKEAQRRGFCNVIGDQLVDLRDGYKPQNPDTSQYNIIKEAIEVAEAAQVFSDPTSINLIVERYNNDPKRAAPRINEGSIQSIADLKELVGRFINTGVKKPEKSKGEITEMPNAPPEYRNESATLQVPATNAGAGMEASSLPITEEKPTALTTIVTAGDNAQGLEDFRARVDTKRARGAAAQKHCR